MRLPGSSELAVFLRIFSSINKKSQETFDRKMDCRLSMDGTLRNAERLEQCGNLRNWDHSGVHFLE